MLSKTMREKNIPRKDLINSPYHPLAHDDFGIADMSFKYTIPTRDISSWSLGFNDRAHHMGLKVLVRQSPIVFPTFNDAGVNKGHPSRCCVRNNKNRAWIKDIAFRNSRRYSGYNEQTRL